MAQRGTKPGSTPAIALAALGLAAVGAIAATAYFVLQTSGSAEAQALPSPDRPAGAASDAGAQGNAGEQQGQPSEAELIRLGERIAERHACGLCHSTDGSDAEGGTWKGLYGSKVRLSSGERVVADEAYIKRSILEPGAELREGYPNQMPPYDGRISDRELEALVAYIRSLE